MVFSSTAPAPENQRRLVKCTGKFQENVQVEALGRVHTELEHLVTEEADYRAAHYYMIVVVV